MHINRYADDGRAVIIAALRRSDVCARVRSELLNDAEEQLFAERLMDRAQVEAPSADRAELLEIAGRAYRARMMQLYRFAS